MLSRQRIRLLGPTEIGLKLLNFSEKPHYETAIYAGFGTELVVELSFSALGCPNVKFEAIRGFVGI